MKATTHKPRKDSSPLSGWAAVPDQKIHDANCHGCQQEEDGEGAAQQWAHEICSWHQRLKAQSCQPQHQCQVPLASHRPPPLDVMSNGWRTPTKAAGKR